MKLHWILIVACLFLLALLLNKPALYFIADILLVKAIYIAIKKNEIKTCLSTKE